MSTASRHEHPVVVAALRGGDPAVATSAATRAGSRSSGSPKPPPPDVRMTKHVPGSQGHAARLVGSPSTLPSCRSTANRARAARAAPPLAPGGGILHAVAAHGQLRRSVSSRRRSSTPSPPRHRPGPPRVGTQARVHGNERVLRLEWFELGDDRAAAEEEGARGVGPVRARPGADARRTRSSRLSHRCTATAAQGEHVDQRARGHGVSGTSLESADRIASTAAAHRDHPAAARRRRAWVEQRALGQVRA